MPQANPLKQMVVKQKNGQPVGICSCCSANDYVIEAALERAKEMIHVYLLNQQQIR